MKTWQGSKPVKCDWCRDDFITVFYDTTTDFGGWMRLCPQCNQHHGLSGGDDNKLGKGVGQKYELKDGIWAKVAG